MVAYSRQRTIHPTRLICREVRRIKRSEWVAVFGVAGISVLGVVFVRSATWQPTPAAQDQKAITTPAVTTPAVTTPAVTTPKAIAPPITQPNPAQPVKPTESKTPEQWIGEWSQGESVEDSRFAIVIGAAEGTRSIDGGKTSLYESHTDPGNGVNNRGSFSYQFGNKENLSPEESSRRQLEQITGHLRNTVLPQAKQAGIELTLFEFINGGDLANQAPLCITSAGGYIERLVEARKMAKAKGWNEYQTVLWARVESFWDTRKNVYDAPGLRAYNDISERESILRDQDRRMSMMKQAMELLGYKIEGGSSYQAMTYNPVALQNFFNQAKGMLGDRIPNGSRGDRVAPLEYTRRFSSAIGLVETQVEK